MLLKIIPVIIIITLSGVISILHPQQNQDADTIIINSINIKTETGESPAEPVDNREAARWAYNNGLTLIGDESPVVDNSAFFITQYQTFIPVSGYKKDKLYRLYIDFLKFEQRRIPFNTRLKIFIGSSSGERREIAVADVNCMKKGNFFQADIPFELSYTGRFDIIIHEYSSHNGNWGIWDIIISSKKINEIEVPPVDSAKKLNEAELKIFK